MGRNKRLLSSLRTALMILLAVAAVCSGPTQMRAQDTLASLRGEFQRQKDPVKRAKLFPKLGTALLAEMRKHIQQKEFDQVPALLAEYRDGASASFNGLESAGRDADKSPGGYRELEIYLRQSLHAVNDVVFSCPAEARDSMLTPQRDLELLDQRLVKALFPAKTDSSKTPPSSPQAHPQR